MQKQFDSISEFIKCKDKCIFCNEKLSACLTNFSGIRKNGLPVLNIQIKNKIIKFNFNQTTALYDIKANCVINTENNEISFTTIDSFNDYVNRTTELAFESIYPHIELYCPNKKCKYGYYLSSAPFSILYPKTLYPTRIYMEVFQTDYNFIENDWTREELCIYSLDNEYAIPIKSSMIDFNLSKPEQILNRVSMLINFN